MFSTMTLTALVSNAGEIVPLFVGLLLISVGVAYGFRFLNRGKKLVK